MAKINELRTEFNVSFVYKISGLDSAKQLLGWLSDTAKSGVMEVKRIRLSDMLERSSERDVALTAPSASDSTAVFVQKILDSGADMVSLTGTYKDAPVVIGIDIRKKTVSLTCRKKKMADYSSLELALKLLD